MSLDLLTIARLQRHVKGAHDFYKGKRKELPMPINTLNLRLPEIGRIRLGKKGGKGEPQKLDTFRLTCASSDTLEYAAKLYGGKVEPWSDKAAGIENQFQLTTAVSELPIMITPAPVSQYMELWSGGGCVRRCDGVVCDHTKPDGELERVPCLCDAQRPECKPTTRFSIVIPTLPGFGTWRVESHGWNAAAELPLSDQVLKQWAMSGRPLVASLAIVKRTKKRVGKPPLHFNIPIIRIPTTPFQMLEAQQSNSALQGPSAPALPAETFDATDERQIIKRLCPTQENWRAVKSGCKMKEVEPGDTAVKAWAEGVRDFDGLNAYIAALPDMPAVAGEEPPGAGTPRGLTPEEWPRFESRCKDLGMDPQEVLRLAEARKIEGIDALLEYVEERFRTHPAEGAGGMFASGGDK